MKRAHTVKFNDPLGLARANERKAGSRTVFRRSPAERETHGEKESVNSARYIHLHNHIHRNVYIYIHTYMYEGGNAFMGERENAEAKRARMAETTSGVHRSVTAIHRLGEIDLEAPAIGSW